MKKITLIFLTALVAITLSGCDQKEEKKKEAFNPLQDPGEYAKDMTGLKGKMEDDVQSVTDKENAKLKAAMESVKGTSTNQNNTQTMEQAQPTNSALPDNSELVKKYKSAKIKTSLGEITFKFYGEDSPITVGNFLRLSQDGFYEKTKFHRVIKDFMIQGGDPLSKEDSAIAWGTGGPGYKFNDEINSHKLVRGSLAMANSGPNTNGSQFFIVTADATPWLDGKHTNFGEVTGGMDVVKKIEAVETGPSDRPTTDVVIEKVTLLEK